MTALTEVQSALADGLQAILEDTGVPGIAVSASRCGAEVSAQAGLACLETASRLSKASRFEMSCLMKFLISSFTMQEVTRGRIRTDLPIEEHLPELGIERSGHRSITIADLMSHSSGLRGVDISQGRIKWGLSWDRLVLHLRTEQRSFPPGTVFNYEHSEHVLLAEILSRRFGSQMDKLLHSEVFGPLGIERGSPKSDRQFNERYVGQHAFAAAKGRYVTSPMPSFSNFWRYSLPDSTVTLAEIRRIAEWVMHEAAGCGLVDELSQSVINIPAQVSSTAAAEVLPKAFGRVCARYGNSVFGHNGSSFGQTIALRIDPVDDIAVVVGVNAWATEARDRAADLALRLLRGEAVEYGTRMEFQPLEFYIQDLVGGFSFDELRGSYVGSYGTRVVVSEQDGNLELTIGADQSEPSRIQIRRRENGLYQIASRRPVSCAFVRHPTNSGPVCFLGVHSYKKVDA